jgi:hypothetical protein
MVSIFWSGGPAQLDTLTGFDLSLRCFVVMMFKKRTD